MATTKKRTPRPSLARIAKATERAAAALKRAEEAQAEAANQYLLLFKERYGDSFFEQTGRRVRTINDLPAASNWPPFVAVRAAFGCIQKIKEAEGGRKSAMALAAERWPDD